MKMPVLVTERLRIRPFTMQDLTAVHEIYQSIDWVQAEHSAAEQIEALRPWLYWNTFNHVEQAKLNQPPYGERAIALQSTDQLIGVCGLVPSFDAFSQLPYWGGVENGRNHPEVGLFWVVGTKHQRQGYAAEAAQGLIDFAFKTLNLARIVATTEHDNIASQSVMRKLGMTVENNPYPGPPWLQAVGILENR